MLAQCIRASKVRTKKKKKKLREMTKHIVTSEENISIDSPNGLTVASTTRKSNLFLRFNGCQKPSIFCFENVQGVVTVLSSTPLLRTCSAKNMEPHLQSFIKKRRFLSGFDIIYVTSIVDIFKFRAETWKIGKQCIHRPLSM